jgi:zeaxanthin glucosyltransferase
VVGPLDAEQGALAAGLGFAPYAPDEYARGSAQAFVESITRMGTLEAARHTFAMLAHATELLLRHAPAVLRSIGAEALVADEIERSASSVAEQLGIPFFTVCSILPTRPEPTIPPFGTPWPYRDTAWSRLRNRLVYRGLGLAMRRNLHTINRYRAEHGLVPLADARDGPARRCAGWMVDARGRLPGASRARLSAPRVAAVLSLRRLVRRNDRSCTSAVSLRAPDLASARLRLARDDARPACRTVPADLPGAPIVVDFAPQLELLSRAQLTITHAGINTTLESLREGVPLVAIPICNDQPGVAARIAWTGTGEFVEVGRVTVPRLEAAIRKVLADPRYRARARRMAEVMRRAGGATRAAEIIDTALATKRPVFSPTAER